MKEIGWTGYRLAASVSAKGIAAGTIYDFLRGDSEITSQKLGHVLDAIGLTIVPAPDSTGTPNRAAKAKTRSSKRRQTRAGGD
jgi:hypothetical protein